MLELIARRLAERGDGLPWESRLADAEAVLDAMREPTAAMIESMILADPLVCDVEEDQRTMIYTEIWQGGIDAAKEGK